MNGMTIPLPNAFTSPPTWSVSTERGSGGKYVREESAHRGTLATHACGLSPRPGGRVLQPRRLRRVPGRGLRGVPAAAARARARADGVPRPAVRRVACARRARALAAFVGARAEDLVFAPNATSALNAVIRSLRIRPEEEILTTKHEYGAILRTLGFIRANVVLVEPEELIANIGIRTRAIVVSHITSPTALVLPVEEICEAARKAGVLSIVDGAHVPGHIPLDVEAVGADVYAGNCHKWLCAPKGSGFLWARPEHQDWIEPLVDQLGLPRGRRLRRAPRLAGDARPGRVPRGAEGDRGARDVRPRRGDGARRRGRAAARRRSGCGRCAGARSPLMRALTVRTQRSAASSGAASTTSTGSRCRCTSGRARRSCASRSARTTTRPTSSGWSSAVRQTLAR